VGLLHMPLQQTYARFADYCWDIYARVHQAYRENKELEERRTEVLHALEEGNNNLAWQGNLIAERIVREQLEEMAAFHIEYDLLIWESDIVREGFWSAAFRLLQASAQFGKEETGPLAGCWVLKSAGETTAPAEKEHMLDKVLVRSNGILTYTAKDIAYHLWKFGLLEMDFAYRPFQQKLWTTARGGVSKAYGQADKVINVIDKRQEYPQQMVKLALETVGFAQAAARLHHVSYGVVSLSRATAALLGIDTSEQKAAYAMSGRQGIGIKIAKLVQQMEQVIEQKRTRKEGLSSREIAIASIRYYLLRFSLQTEIVFDMEQATEVSGNTGVYLLYGYTRGYNILRKAAGGVIEVPATVNRQDLHPAELDLLRHLITWSDVVEIALQELAPHFICNYAFTLASLFHHFYAACPVIQEPDSVKRSFRLWLTSVYCKRLAEALHILGLPTPTEM
jgi:arginyl-tRNA synthetase